MNIETTSDLCEQLADWIGVYGACKADECAEGCDNPSPLCCRVGFILEIRQRMIDAVENDKKLDSVGLQS